MPTAPYGEPQVSGGHATQDLVGSQETVAYSKRECLSASSKAFDPLFAARSVTVRSNQLPKQEDPKWPQDNKNKM